jgi:CelD/BcsL family acetyltransferase involved in cellulose biosynthesis
LRFEKATAQNLEACLKTFFRLHQARWMFQGQAGVLADPAVQQFHRQAAPALMREGLLRLYVLYVGDRPLAALYGLAARRRFYYYLSGFNPELSTLSPGTLIIGCAIEEAIAERAVEFDFLRGRERYKYLWGAQDRPIFRRQVYSATAPPYAEGQRVGVR